MIEVTVPAVLAWLREQVTLQSLLTFKPQSSCYCPVARYICAQRGVKPGEGGLSTVSGGAFSYQIGMAQHQTPVDLSTLIVEFDVRADKNGVDARKALAIFDAVVEEFSL